MHIRYDKMLGTRLPLLFCLGAFFCGALAGEKAGNGSEHPLLLYEHPLPPPRENPDSNAAIPPESTSGGDKQTKKQESADRSGTKFRVGLGFGIPNSPPSENNKTDEPVPPSGEKGFSRGNARKMEKNGGASPTNMPTAVLPATEETPPTPEAVEQYRVRLEQRLLERYNNIPDYAGKVARVAVVVSKPMEVSFDARLIRV
ncbi:MAG: hypothetical protein FWG74_06065, partial [Planctomycetes bacterium]|nr:hypothetical protein [Planctomycetota bacterium]